MCFNALTFVIQAWQGYEGMFENLGELLEKCVEFLERLDYYKPKMDVRLSRLACQNLQLFVELCDRMIKLRKKHTRLLAFTKQLFLNDNGIQELLGMMDRLNSKESLLVSAQTYKIVSDSADGIKLILDGQQEQKKLEDSKNWRKKIVAALGFAPASLGNDGEPVAGWERTISHRKNRLVEGTGRWLTDNEAFVSWSQSSAPEQSLFVIEGKPGSGKTSLMANGLRLVRKHGGSSASTSTRIVSACYSPESDTKKNMEHIDGVFFESASKALLWQLCTSYEAMTKSTAYIIDRQQEFDGNMDLWQNLFFENRELHNQDTTFFIFLDGIDPDFRSFVPLLQKLSAQPELRRKVRVCLTIQTQAAKDWLVPSRRIPFHKILISDHNIEDVKKYILFQLDSLPIFKDSGRPGIQQWRDRILGTLVEKCEGDYFRINNILKSLSRVDLISDIEAILADAGKTRVDQIDSEIQRLNEERTPTEIDEINTIIRWVSYGLVYINIDTLQSLLSLRSRRRNKETTPGDAQAHSSKLGPPEERKKAPSAEPLSALSLLPFRQKLQEKYTIFAVDEAGRVDWRTPEIRDRIPAKALGEDALEDNTTGLLGVVRDSEVQVVRHFLHTVCPPDLYRRFGFEQFFETKLGVGRKEKIHDDKENAQILCAIDCLHILVDDELSSDIELHKLAMHSLLVHITNTDLALADRNLKEQVGPLLVRVLTESGPIDRLFVPLVRPDFWTQQRMELDSWYEDNRVEWIYSGQATEVIVKWLRDSAVTKSISGELAGELLRGAKDASSNKTEVVLGYVAKRMARHLFDGRMAGLYDRGSERSAAMHILRVYLARIDPTGPNEATAKLLQHEYEDFWHSEARDYFENYECSSDFLAHAERWAIEILGRTNETSAWEMNMALNYEQLTRIHWHTQSKPNSMRAKRALELDPSNWDALLYLSSDPQYHNIPDEEAFDLLQKAKAQIEEARQKDSTWLNDPSKGTVLANIMLELGKALWHKSLYSDGPDSGDPLNEKLVEAAAIHRQSLEFGDPNFRIIGNIARLYDREEGWGLWMQFIKTLTSYSHRWSPLIADVNKNMLRSYYSSWDWPMQNKFAHAADCADGWDTVKAFFAACIAASNTYGEPRLQFDIRLHYGMTLFISTNNERQSEGLGILLDLLNMKFDKEAADRPRYDSEIDIEASLAIYYLREAIAENQTEARRLELGEKLAKFIDEHPRRFYFGPYDRHLTLACCLIRYEVRFKNGKLSDLAQSCLRHIIMNALELLSDDIEDNDASAFSILQTILAVLGDLDNFRTAWFMWAALAWDEKRDGEKKFVEEFKEEAVLIRIPQSDSDDGEQEKGPGEAGEAEVSQGGTDDGPPGGLPTNANEETVEDDDSDTASVISDLRYSGLGYSIWETCRYCGQAWTTMSKPMRICLDCPGRFCVDEACYRDFKAGKQSNYMGMMGAPALQCSPHHTFFAAPGCSYSTRKAIPSGHVVVGGSTKDDLKLATLEEWKAALREKYMQGFVQEGEEDSE
ncbi:hypothetical protein jhhlp_005374 [Lomentospora prolificans]|uniref:Nephrocystin 3-like N-terminal domain-containing protein n=1 Tax=Lomentospora prolificans TaxID=41688 RepID=A0A2N3N6N2_9PEZI|nr:hypothetical protein jhhlp_005374 [Lomentospora prolificans]